MIQATTIEAVQSAVRNSRRLRPRGGGTKPSLAAARDGAVSLDLTGLSGVLAYDPGEFTFTALAGTWVSDVQAMLAEHGQYLPFDPPLAEQGATLGGTVAAGLSGPGRYRYGGVRDFILGVQLVDGQGQMVRGGGKVVKNSAGFDIAKLMVGSLGQLGVLVEVTFKVFPQAPAHVTVRQDYAHLAEAVAALTNLYTARLDIDALDLTPENGAAALWVRLGGLHEALPARAERIRGRLGGGEVLEGEAETGVWRQARAFAWAPAGWSLVKVPLTPRRLVELESRLRELDTARRYSAGGNVAWIAAAAGAAGLDQALLSLDLSGLALSGPPDHLYLGAPPSGQAFARRVKAVLDPENRFGNDP